MAQRFFQEITREPVSSPHVLNVARSPKRDWAAALRISPTRLAGFVAVHVLQTKHGHVAQRFARLLLGLTGSYLCILRTAFRGRLRRAPFTVGAASRS